eukprot:2024507-Amphidinium_carterae.2
MPHAEALHFVLLYSTIKLKTKLEWHRCNMLLLDMRMGPQYHEGFQGKKDDIVRQDENTHYVPHQSVTCAWPATTAANPIEISRWSRIPVASPKWHIDGKKVRQLLSM